jgi:hypothetical protein
LKERTQLTVVDANRKKVGKVLGLAGGPHANPWGPVGAVIPGMSSGVLVAFQVKGHPPFVVGVMPNHFTGNTPLVFVSADCSGPPLLSESTIVLVGADLGGYSWTDGGSLLPSVAVANPGQTVYIPDPAAPLQSIVEGSILIGGQCNPVSGSPPTQARSALALIDLAGFFTPPFRLR